MSRCDVALDLCITGPYSLANAFSICIADFSPALYISHCSGGPPFLGDPDRFSSGTSAASLRRPIAGLVQSETHATLIYNIS